MDRTCPLKEGATAPTSIAQLVQRTPSRLKIGLKSLYIDGPSPKHPYGHANLVFPDDTNWPMNDPYEVVELVSGQLLRILFTAAL